MRTIQKRKTVLGRLIVPAVTVAVLSYFLLHAQTGRYGSEAKLALNRHLAERNAEYAELLAKRHKLEQRVQQLKDGTLEKDMLDERARQALNVARDDEIVILR
ncbi:septum formation initiator family protein [Jiella sp. MQZ9-1]|uniref:Septum formation initiator family protein n=1 Tax=Jiella flava TaxID=2816857 RepID=A0A939FXH9_9HYPH|nr:septum formation initiator family protein [Jiella flava]MBO0662694.1 septum formation initiator family protein [Jiella flava]MCD2471116.1 septum formation initiator family protein [Jiella flava]